LDRLLEKAPDARYQTADELGTAFDMVMGDYASQSRPDDVGAWVDGLFRSLRAAGDWATLSTMAIINDPTIDVDMDELKSSVTKSVPRNEVMVPAGAKSK
jgi:hypothetical protein